MNSPSAINALRPVSKNHAIKEVVLTLFVKTNLLHLNKLRHLCDSPLDFHEYEQLVSRTVEFKEPDKTDVTIKVEQPGSRIIRYKKGLPIEIVQAINEDDNDRYFISYHSLDYSRWKHFKERFFEVFSSVSPIEPNATITALSLHYIDEFDWKSNDRIPLEHIFLKNGILINDFFGSQNSDVSITLEKTVAGVKFLDRVNVRISTPQTGKIIRVSHNLSVPFDKGVDLIDFVGVARSNYEETLQVIHEYNKSTLKGLFTKPVLDLIKLY
jgi:uncharacterized protein (TIGR04255 family)